MVQATAKKREGCDQRGRRRYGCRLGSAEDERHERVNTLPYPGAMIVLFARGEQTAPVIARSYPP